MFAASCGLIMIAGTAAAGPLQAAAATKPAVRPVVIEMFLSQACKSSPPAAVTLRDLAGRRDVVALAYHVPYWDELPSHKSGAWADPFAREAFAERQKRYNKRIRRTDMVYTPQAVIDGVFDATGSKRDMLDARITEAQVLDEHARPAPPLLKVARGDKIRVQIDGVGAPYDAFAVTFRPQALTEVESGDNAGAVFDEINVVTAVATLTQGAEGAQSLAFEAPPAGEDCAVLVQERGQGRIVAARYCSPR
ncbi:MAG TPA: DUF1223 domain-containing protein [Parvularcula sp.]|nr:DUF1223 domain-containing protein [Parvularcula sp.]